MEEHLITVQILKTVMFEDGTTEIAEGLLRATGIEIIIP